MPNKKFVLSILSIVLIAAAAGASVAQNRPSDASDSQRIDVMRDKLERMKRSLDGMITSVKSDTKGANSGGKKDDKKSLDTPLGRLEGLMKDVNRLFGDVNSLRGKVDRSEKYERSDVDNYEQAVNELQARVDRAQSEIAASRSVAETTAGKPREVKKKGKFLGIFGKGGNDEYDELLGTVSPGRDKELFVFATREVRKKRFDVGRLLYQTIITTYPDSPYLPMSKLAIADSFFLEGSASSLIQAIAAYQDWLTFFPTHPLADRVVLKIAESEMRQIGLPDRDATRAKRAETRLKALMQQYPNSILLADARQRLKEVQDNLGLHNLYIANYYYTLSVDQKKGGLKGAQSRYREILDKYPDFCFMDEALFKLAVTYQLEEETDQAARYFQRIVQQYPDSEYYQKAKEQLELIGATVPATEVNQQVKPCAEPGFFQNFKNQFFGIYPMTIDKNGVLISKDFDRDKFELIDQIIENQGEITTNQIPQALTTVISRKSSGPPVPADPEAPKQP